VSKIEIIYAIYALIEKRGFKLNICRILNRNLSKCKAYGVVSTVNNVITYQKEEQLSLKGCSSF